MIKPIKKINVVFSFILPVVFVTLMVVFILPKPLVDIMPLEMKSFNENQMGCLLNLIDGSGLTGWKNTFKLFVKFNKHLYLQEVLKSALPEVHRAVLECISKNDTVFDSELFNKIILDENKIVHISLQHIRRFDSEELKCISEAYWNLNDAYRKLVVSMEYGDVSLADIIRFCNCISYLGRILGIPFNGKFDFH